MLFNQKIFFSVGLKKKIPIYILKTGIAIDFFLLMNKEIFQIKFCC